MKKLLTIALIAVSSASFAQGIIGPKVGLSISNFRDVKSTFGTTDYTPILTPQVGVVFNARLGDVISLRPEILYVQRGAKLSTWGGTATARLSYAEIPFNVVGGIPVGPGKIEISAGPSVGYLFGGKIKAPGGDLKVKGEDEPANGGAADEAYFNYLNVSMNAGIGYNWKGLILQVSYNYGFSNINPHAEDRDSPAEELRNDNITRASAVTVGLTYLFGGKED